MERSGIIYNFRRAETTTRPTTSIFGIWNLGFVLWNLPYEISPYIPWLLFHHPNITYTIPANYPDDVLSAGKT